MEYIDMEKWPRKEHFRFFQGMDYPQTNVCMNLDITHFLEFVKENHLSFYYSMIFAATHTANEIDSFRYRIRGDGVVLHDRVHPSFTDLSEGSELFKFVTLEMEGDIISFSNHTKEVSRNTKENLSNENRDDLIYYTCLPWISFTSVCHALTLGKEDSIPRISWGKYFRDGEKVLLPFSVQVNHSLLDGFHIGKYVNRLQEYIDQI
jgi:chloramphenicol O-acetyltransferase type A